ncbi:MAG: hypothetical protein COA96_05865, partial [SAR86 cluster bacterium]
LGVSHQSAIIVGFGLALSSTAFCLQLLSERGGISTPMGRRVFSILLMQSNRHFYRNLATELQTAAQNVDGYKVKLHIHHIDNLSPNNVAENILKYGIGSDGLAIKSAHHPLIIESINFADCSFSQTNSR